MQQFSLPPKEKVRGMLGNAESADGNFYVWTTNGLYEIRQKMSPEKIFFQLLAKGLEKTDAEPFGKTFRLDLFSLYEEAADREFDAGNYGRALDLYYLSNVRTSKLIGKYLEIGRMDIVMTHLKGTLHQPEALPVGDRKMLSDILFKCYLQKLLVSKEDFKPLEHEFHSFLALNQDYDAGKALVMLLNSGLTDYFLEVAHSRKLMPTALNILVNRGSLFLDMNHINFLKVGYGNELRACGGGSIFRCLPTELQIKLILEDPASIPRNVRRIASLLSSLDDQTLLDVAHCFDPLGDNIHLILNADTAPVASHTTPPTSPLASPVTEHAVETPVRPEEYLELFITTLLCLNHKRTILKLPNAHPLNVSTRQLSVLRTSRSQSPLTHSPRSPTYASMPRTGSAVELTDSIPPIASFSDRKAVKVACGWHHACFVTDSGELYTWGKNTSGQLGHGSTTKAHHTPKRVDALRGVVVSMVSCGFEHTVIADQSHSVYSWGAGNVGQLGLGIKQMQPLPRKMEALQGVKIRQIACGYSHTVFLTKSGEVYSTGHGEQGQLGLGGQANKLAPTRVEAQEIAESGKGSSIACGLSTVISCIDVRRHSHTVLCTEAGDVYSWGAGAKGQLGHGSLISFPAPKLVNSLRGKNIRNVACGRFHTIAISDLNNVYSWGSGNKMRLGHGGDRDEFVPRIVEVLMNKNVRSAACGNTHTAALCTEQNGEMGVYVWGGAENGKLGLGDDIQFCKPLPTLIPGLSGAKITAVECGDDFTLACSENGTLYSWGVNEHGQLGLGDVKNCSVPTPIPTSLSDRTSRMLGISSSSDNTNDSTVLYGQDILDSTLRAQFKLYRHGVIISRCLEYGNFNSAASVSSHFPLKN